MEKKKRKGVQMTEGKRNIIAQLINEYLQKIFKKL